MLLVLLASRAFVIGLIYRANNGLCCHKWSPISSLMLKTISLVPMQIDILCLMYISKTMFCALRGLVAIRCYFLGGVDGENIGKGAGLVGWAGM